MAARSRRRGKKGSRKRARPKNRLSRARAYLVGAGALCASLLIWAALAWVTAGQEAVRRLNEDLPGAPIEVLAASRVIQTGRAIDSRALVSDLRELGYRATSSLPRRPGEYRQLAGGLEIYRREFSAERGPVPAAFVRVKVGDGEVRRLTGAAGEELSAFRCEPLSLGSFQGDLLQRREPLPLSSFPPRLVDAVLSAEDSRFLDHGGIDPRGIVRAAWTDLRSGAAAQGGSTITQQVIKNRLLDSRRTLTRKLKEALLAVYVERRVSKQRLLEIYLNEVYLGQDGARSIIGLPAAARHYFGRRVGDLDLGQMALLAGMIASPGKYDPYRHPQRAAARRAWVLARMRSRAQIDQAEERAAGSRPLHLAPRDERPADGGDVLDAVQRELSARGWEPSPGPRPARVFTSIEPGLQRAARRALARTLDELEKQRPSRKPLEGAVVVLSAGSAEIVALVGGREPNRGGFHRALDARRAPGSAFKPFVALSAIESGRWNGVSPVEDAPLELRAGGKTWRPANYDRTFRGTVTLRRALEQSLNVPLVRVLLEVGPRAVIDAARRAGIDGRLPEAPALGLGAGEVSPLELATGFLTLADLGDYRRPGLVRGVSLDDGDPVSLAPRPARSDAIADEDAWLTLNLLEGVARRGTGRALASRLAGYRVAAKTGTSQEGRDAWFVLVSGRAVVLAWVGRDDGKPAGLTGAGAALPVVRRLLDSSAESLLGSLPPPPDGVVEGPYDAERACLLSASAEDSPREAFRAGAEPRACRGSWWRRLWGRP